MFAYTHKIKVFCCFFTVVCLEPVFSNPPVILSPLQAPVIFPQNYPLRPLCPPHLAPALCRAFSSFSIMRHLQNGTMEPDMLTPFITESRNISKRRLERRLSSSREWDSWEYSEREHKYTRISEEERKEPKESYHRIHTNRDQVITENKNSSGEFSISEGVLKAIRTVDASPQRSAPSILQEKEGETLSAEMEKSKEEEKPKTPTEEDKVQDQEVSPEWFTSRPTRAVSVEVSHRDSSPSHSCANLGSAVTEAGSVCSDCLREDQKDLTEQFKTNLKNKISKMVCVSGGGEAFIELIKENFNRSCSPKKFNDYVKNTLICSSCKAQIPPAFMLSMISIESAGNCEAIGDETGGHRSVGLFQIYSKFHTGRAEKKCPRESFKSCAGDPVSGLQMSMDIVNEAYKKMNQNQVKDFNCPSEPSIPSDSWRKTLAAYNAGSGNIKKMKGRISQRPQGITAEAWNSMSEWEKIRTHYFISCESGVWLCRHAMANLAHVEVGLGRSDKKNDHPSLYQSWDKLAKDLGLKNLNDNKHCSD